MQCAALCVSPHRDAANPGDDVAGAGELSCASPPLTYEYMSFSWTLQSSYHLPSRSSTHCTIIGSSPFLLGYLWLCPKRPCSDLASDLARDLVLNWEMCDLASSGT